MEMRDNKRLLGSIDCRQRIGGLSTREWEKKNIGCFGRRVYGRNADLSADPFHPIHFEFCVLVLYIPNPVWVPNCLTFKFSLSSLLSKLSRSQQ